MTNLLSWLNSTLFDGLPYSIVALSFVLTFKYIRFPDVTCAGTFVFGAAAAAATTVHLSVHPLVALLSAALAGAVGGLLTSLFNVALKIERILAGILSAFALYAVSSIILRPTLPYGDASTVLSWAADLDRAIAFQGVPWHPYIIAEVAMMALGVKLFLDGLLASEFGLALRAMEDEEAGPSVLRNLGLAPGAFQTFALVVGNAMVAMGGALVSMKEGAANIQRGFDVLITGLIAFLLGVQLQRWLPNLAERMGKRPGLGWLRGLVRIRRLRITSLALAGPLLYFGLITLSYGIEIKPELTKLLLAFFVAATVGDFGTIVSRMMRRRLGPSIIPLDGSTALGGLTKSSASGLPEALVEARDLEFRYPGSNEPILVNVAFRLRKGEFMMLRGPNGSGKSTLLKLLAGHIEELDGGTICINGADLTWEPAHRRRICSYIAQDPRSGVVATFTAFENLALACTGGRTSPMRRALTRRRISDLGGMLRSFSFVETAALRPSGSLSGGQRQVLNLLSLLAKQPPPEAVFLDEPFNNLDMANLDRCVHAILALKERGVAVVLVNHFASVELPIDGCYDLVVPLRLSDGDADFIGERSARS